jgi:hypothetical protein
MMVLGRVGPARLAVDDDVISRKKKPAQGAKQIPLELSPAGISKSLLYVYQKPKTSYLNKPLNNYFQSPSLEARISGTSSIGLSFSASQR